MIALSVSDPDPNGAALVVVYRRDGSYEVDRTEPMVDHAEIELMKPYLYAVVDVRKLSGFGRIRLPQDHSHFQYLLQNGSPVPLPTFWEKW